MTEGNIVKIVTHHVTKSSYSSTIIINSAAANCGQMTEAIKGQHEINFD